MKLTESWSVATLFSFGSYHFLCNDWLTTGQPQLILPVCPSDQVSSSSNLFTENMTYKMSEDHALASTIIRPHHSHFTRVQRLACLLHFVFMQMIASAMYYGQEGTEERPLGLTIGPLNITLTQVYISLMTVMITMPANLLIITLFKKACPQRQNLVFTTTKGTQPDSVPGSSKQNGTTKEFVQYSITSNGKKDGLWSHKCLYLAWSLCVLSILAAGFFCVLYSHEWGFQKSHEWVQMIGLSICCSVLIIDPLKVGPGVYSANIALREINFAFKFIQVLFLSLILAYILKRPPDLIRSQESSNFHQAEYWLMTCASGAVTSQCKFLIHS